MSHERGSIAIRMRKFAALLVILCVIVPAFGAARKSSQSKKSVRTSAAVKTRGKKTVAAKTGSKKTTRRVSSTKTTRRVSSKKASKKPTAKRASWRGGQMQPTPERYAEIQQALVTKGYASGPATGVWTPEWADALKRFQQDQKLEPTGKLSSLSLMALGLGPKREAAVPALNPDPQGVADKRPIPQ